MAVKEDAGRRRVRRRRNSLLFFCLPSSPRWPMSAGWARRPRAGGSASASWLRSVGLTSMYRRSWPPWAPVRAEHDRGRRPGREGNWPTAPGQVRGGGQAGSVAPGWPGARSLRGASPAASFCGTGSVRTGSTRTDSVRGEPKMRSATLISRSARSRTCSNRCRTCSTRSCSRSAGSRWGSARCGPSWCPCGGRGG